MPDPANSGLAKFTVEKEEDAYRLHIEDDAGVTIELTATFEQLELLADTLDDLLGADDAGAAIDEETSSPD